MKSIYTGWSTSKISPTSMEFNSYSLIRSISLRSSISVCIFPSISLSREMAKRQTCWKLMCLWAVVSSASWDVGTSQVPHHYLKALPCLIGNFEELISNKPIQNKLIHTLKYICLQSSDLGLNRSFHKTQAAYSSI